MTTPLSALKILTVGPAVGSIRELFSKVKAINAKHGKFEFVLCVGDFFGPSGQNGPESNEVVELLEGEIEAPLPCYVMQGNNPIPEKVIERFASEGSEICRNVFLLSKSGVLTTAHGLRIACLGGVYDEAVYASASTPLGFLDPYFSSQTIEKLTTNISSTTQKGASSLSALMQASVKSHLVDILISHVWPAPVVAESTAPPAGPIPVVDALDGVVRVAKPRYHFAVGAGEVPQFWEREPFAWDDEDGRVTRFVALGAFGCPNEAQKKPRWFYAFSLAPHSTAGTSVQPRPANTTANPFTSTSRKPRARQKRDHESGEPQNFIFGDVQQPNKRTRRDKPEGGKPPVGYRCKICDSAEHFINECPDRSKPPEGYICKVCNEPGHFVRDCPQKHTPGDTGGRKPPPGYVCRACASELHLIQDCPVAQQQRVSRGGRGGGRGPPREIGPNECWFCLSNPSVAKHLLVSIGSECYLTLPKGQIIPTGEEAKSRKDIAMVPGGGHVLIVPVTHYPTLTSMPPDISVPIIEELEKYKSALRGLYSAHDARLVSFEVGILSGKGGHAHVQCVPVPIDLADMVGDAFVQGGKKQGITFEEDAQKALESCSGGRRNYFRVDLPDGHKLVHLIKAEVPFSIQFGRQVLCNLLNIPDRMDWKACTQSESEERADAQTFRTAFSKYDTVQS